MSLGSGAVAHAAAADDAVGATDALDDAPDDEHAAAIRASASRAGGTRRGNIQGSVAKSVGTRRRG
jgi:hypothetical protein